MPNHLIDSPNLLDKILSEVNPNEVPPIAESKVDLIISIIQNVSGIALDKYYENKYRGKCFGWSFEIFKQEVVSTPNNMFEAILGIKTSQSCVSLELQSREGNRLIYRTENESAEVAEAITTLFQVCVQLNEQSLRIQALRDLLETNTHAHTIFTGSYWNIV